MISYTPLSQWPSAHVVTHAAIDHLDAIEWVALGDTEVLLCAHFYPLAIRLDGVRPVLGALVRRDMMVRDLKAPDGRWLGAYLPIALRCFPMRLNGVPTGAPLVDLEVARLPLGDAKPRALPIKDADGKCTKELTALYQGLCVVSAAQDKLAPALDLLVVSNFLAATTRPDGAGRGPDYYTVDRGRVELASKHAFEAMGRHAFTCLDLMTALTFSQAHMPALMRAAISTQKLEAAEVVDHMPTIDQTLPWLDTSELFPGPWAADAQVWQGFAGTSTAPDAGSEVGPKERSGSQI
jgi:hypothetical protein